MQYLRKSMSANVTFRKRREIFFLEQLLKILHYSKNSHNVSNYK